MFPNQNSQIASHELFVLLLFSLVGSSVQVKMVSVTCAKGKCPSLRSNASLRCFPNVAFETVPMFV